MSQKEPGDLRDPYTMATPFNQIEFIVLRTVTEMVNTSALVRIDGCTSKGPDGPAGSVNATPLVAQTDPQGNALPMTSLPSLPHYRVQAGIAAIILDPVAGDIGVASFCKTDSSTVKTGTTKPQRPGSYRTFDQADGMLVASVSNKAPEVWIELKQDKTIIIHAPEGVTIETDKTVEIKAARGIVLDSPQTTITGNLTATGEKGDNIGMKGTVNLDGSMTSTGDQVAGGISQTQHTHTGVMPGGGDSGKPQ